MKILFTGGGTGGHFYPIIAVAEAVNDLVRERKLLEPKLYYAAPDPYDREMLVSNGITFVPTAAGKIRNYASILNIVDYFKTAWGIMRSVIRIFFLYPDVVFGKGGYASFPTLLAARIFRIPVVIHESDADPGRVNRWAGQFARKIAISYPETLSFFPKERTAYTGLPIRKAALMPSREGMHQFLGFVPEFPVILVLGGSQGSTAINDVVLDLLPGLLEHYQVVHQTGEANFADVSGRASVILRDSLYADRYKPFGYLNDVAMRMSAGAASLVISRAGSTLFEIAAWGLPSILVPIPKPISHDQEHNALAYARAGACTMIEQGNLTPRLLLAEIERIVKTDTGRHMAEKARAFARADAARVIAEALLDIGLTHEA